MRAVLLACFFLSGASGLILEILWTRKLTLVFGSTTLAVSTVLTAFMGGLGLGSYLAGSWADRLKNPVRAYALAEAAIGLYALLVPLILMASTRGSTSGCGPGFGDRYALLCRCCASSASAGLLLVPTTLMGATLPILARYFVSRPFELRRVRPAPRHALRGQPVRRGRRLVLRRLRLPAAARRALDQRHRGRLRPVAGGGDPGRAPSRPGGGGRHRHRRGAPGRRRGRGAPGAGLRCRPRRSSTRARAAPRWSRSRSRAPPR